MQSTQSKFTSELLEVAIRYLCPVSLLELKLFTAWDPQQYFRTAGRKTGKLL